MNSKIVYINDQPTNYLIYEDGRLYNINSNKYLKGTIHGNYRIYAIRLKNSLEFCYSESMSQQHQHHLGDFSLPNLLKQSAF